jgi:hypothetical protein
MKKTVSSITILVIFLILISVAFAGESEAGHGSGEWFDLVKKSFNFLVLIVCFTGF